MGRSEYNGRLYWIYLRKDFYILHEMGSSRRTYSFPIYAIATGDKEIAKMAIDFYIYMGVCFAIFALAFYAQYKLTPIEEEREKQKKEREEELKITYDKESICTFAISWWIIWKIIDIQDNY